LIDCRLSVFCGPKNEKNPIGRVPSQGPYRKNRTRHELHVVATWSIDYKTAVIAGANLVELIGDGSDQPIPLKPIARS